MIGEDCGFTNVREEDRRDAEAGDLGMALYKLWTRSYARPSHAEDSASWKICGFRGPMSAKSMRGNRSKTGDIDDLREYAAVV